MEGKPKIQITLTDEQFEFLNANSSVINGESYFMPFWFRRVDGNIFEMFSLGNLPKDMSREIGQMQEQVKMDIIENQFDSNAYFKK